MRPGHPDHPHLSAGLHVTLHAPEPGIECVPGAGGPDPGALPDQSESSWREMDQ